MTLLLNRVVQGPKTHALVIGVGNYPHAAQGVDADLQNVPNLPSAADSAKRMCDWLLDNQDNLAAPLATLEVLISDPSNPNDRYPWIRGPVDPATEANVKNHGKNWFDLVTAEAGNAAFFYCCGHGASHLEEPVVFLEDLNQNDINAWTHINLSSLARSLRKVSSISAAFLFSDACGEYVTKFELGEALETRFFAEPKGFKTSNNKVSLLCAAAGGHLAYEGTVAKDSNLKFGRFTQTLIMALNGSSARWSQQKWGVSCRELPNDLKLLRRIFFSHWSDDEPFEPYPTFSQTDPIPIVFPTNFELPVVVMTDPLDQLPHYGLIISRRDDPAPPWLKDRNAGDSTAWATTVPPSFDIHYAIAVNGAGHRSRGFQPVQPLFDQLWVAVP